MTSNIGGVTRETFWNLGSQSKPRQWDSICQRETLDSLERSPTLLQELLTSRRHLLSQTLERILDVVEETGFDSIDVKAA